MLKRLSLLGEKGRSLYPDLSGSLILSTTQHVSRSLIYQSAKHAASIGHAAKKRRFTLSKGFIYC